MIRENVSAIVILGAESQAGSYLLRIRVWEDLLLPFGSFKKGKVVAVPAGEYVYVGSALAAKGGVSLGRRLVRHATRSGEKRPHAIRARMLDQFEAIRLGSGNLLPAAGKRLFWNVDHLLDQEAVEITGVVVIRSEVRMERELGQFMEQEPCTRVIERGLGANDVPGNTHLLRVDADEAWWRSLPERLLGLMEREPIFHSYPFGPEERERLDREGHLALPGILTESARASLVTSLSRIQSMDMGRPEPANHYAGERDPYLASLIAHPQLLTLARQVLGAEIRFDHCVSLNRPPGDGGIHWHSHAYADDRPDLGFVRIFFYVNGFTANDGGLGVVPGSHLFRDPRLRAGSDAALQAGWIAGKRHPATGEPLAIEYLSAPPGTVILMWTHAAHAVSPRQPGSDTRWAVVYAYRNPGAESRARWITPAFERQPPEGAEGLMGLY